VDCFADTIPLQAVISRGQSSNIQRGKTAAVYVFLSAIVVNIRIVFPKGDIDYFLNWVT